jgi:outer membrane lipoprotein-sorting protein
MTQLASLRALLLPAILATVIGFGFAGTASAEDTPSVDEIVNRANLISYYQARDGRAQVAMTITDDQGRVRERRLTVLRRDTPETDDIAGGAYRGEQKYYAYFHRPADVNKMVFMVWKNLDRDDDRWLYLPALDLVKRIAAADKRTSFAGSDLLYEDVSGRDVTLDSHELVETTKNYYVVKHTPLDPGAVEFAHYVTYVHKGTFLPVRIEYFDDNGEKFRTVEAQKVEMVQGYATVTKSRIANLRTGSVTEVEFSDVAYDVGLPEDVFTERFLRRAPRNYLR